MPDKVIIIKERDHVHMDAVEKPCLVDGYIDHMVSCFEQEVGFFRGFYPGWQEYRAAAGSADAEITVPLVDIFDDFRNNGDLAQAGAVRELVYMMLILLECSSKNRYGSERGFS